ncbi:MAG: hypothetical protein M5U19_14305 [Microthrixaceae bacterium]|nr:hypothetical protein [Microthrixaceae bacterium]
MPSRISGTDTAPLGMYSHGADGSGGRRSFTLRRSLAALVVPAISLLLSGCLTTDAYLTVDDDGSGELRLEVFPPPAVSGALDTSGVEALARDTIEGWTARASSPRNARVRRSTR